METARNSVVVDLPVDQAHRRWLEFVGQAPAEGGARPEQVGSEQVTDRLEGQKGTIYFEELNGGSTRATMELRYNPTALREAGLDRDWVAARIGMYLQRFQRSSAS